MQRRWWLGRTSNEARTPPWADALVQVTTFALGDAPSAQLLVGWTLQDARACGTAVRALYTMLPDTWLAWPSVGPREWLELHLRPNDAERLIAVLGEWSPHDRFVLGLHLILDIPRDQLTRWVSRDDAGLRVTELLGHVGRSIGWSERYLLTPACDAVADELLEANDPALGRAARLHFLGCVACRTQATALHKARELVRLALTIFFAIRPGAALGSAPTPMAQPPWHRKRRVGWRVLAILTLFVLGWVWGQRSAPAAGQPQMAVSAASNVPLTATAVIDRALGRWEHGSTMGVSYERYRAQSGETNLVVERWYDWAAPHRLQIVVRDGRNQPILHLYSDGATRLSYIIHTSADARPALVEDQRVAVLQPLLRQLPSVGPLGSFPADDQFFDQRLLWDARRNHPRLLGATTVGGRRALRLIYTAGDGATMLMAVDRATSTLLEATRTLPGSTQGQRVWYAEALEMVPRVPAALETPTAPRAALPDPRQLVRANASNTDMITLLQRSRPFATPTMLPGEPLVAFVRDLNTQGTEVLQIYEGTNWTLLISTYQHTDYSPMPEGVWHQSGNIRYTLVPGTPPDVSKAAWQLGDQVYGSASLWMAQADGVTRSAALQIMLQSLQPLTVDNATHWQARFVPPAPTTRRTIDDARDSRVAP